jgi:hypothetical protein
MTAMMIGPYGDNASNFVHLDKVAIKLIICWKDDDDNNFKNHDVIELSRFDSLFKILTRRASFYTWYRLTIMPIRYQLYKHHGTDWFESAHDVIRRDVQDSIQRFQYNLHTSPTPTLSPPIFVLEV